MAMARKVQIGKAFASAAARYDENAAPHEVVAGRLINFAASEQLPSAPAILEIGCGTGLLTRAIRQQWPQATITATDIAPEMLRATESRGVADRLLIMDGEAPNLGDERFDLIVSSLTFQWFESLPSALSRIMGLLAPQAILCFATMGADSFSDWRDAHAREGLACGMQDYPSLNGLNQILTKLGDYEAMDDVVPLPHSGGKALVQHFHAIGAHVPRPDYRPLSAGALRRVIARFDREDGQAAYHILYGKVRNG
jgi:malonyl-CoA O-methyltransferase